jgi:SAM-dependent methyltransferase
MRTENLSLPTFPPLLRRREAYDIDDPRTTDLRRGIIDNNRFLRRVYHEWYQLLSAAIPPGPGKVLELGSGAGFLSEYVPEVITSDVFGCQGIHAVLDGRQLPFASASLRAIIMIDVLHHIPEIRPFLREAERCLVPGGAVVMIEPWVSTWSRFIYGRLHHEPFDPDVRDWSFPSRGPLSGANGALPWIVFERDRAAFDREFPNLRIAGIQPMMPFRYLVSGGVSMRQLMPEAAFPVWTRVDRLLSRWRETWPMFALISVQKTSARFLQTTGRYILR